MRYFFCIALCLAFLSTAFADQDRPNVVLILIDDMGLHDLSIEGSTFYESPQY